VLDKCGTAACIFVAKRGALPIAVLLRQLRSTDCPLLGRTVRRREQHAAGAMFRPTANARKNDRETAGAFIALVRTDGRNTWPYHAAVRGVRSALDCGREVVYQNPVPGAHTAAIRDLATLAGHALPAGHEALTIAHGCAG
jgi:hypothetical protein